MYLYLPIRWAKSQKKEVLSAIAERLSFRWLSNNNNNVDCCALRFSLCFQCIYVYIRHPSLLYSDQYPEQDDGGLGHINCVPDPQREEHLQKDTRVVLKCSRSLMILLPFSCFSCNPVGRITDKLQYLFYHKVGQRLRRTSMDPRSKAFCGSHVFLKASFLYQTLFLLWVLCYQNKIHGHLYMYTLYGTLQYM